MNFAGPAAAQAEGDAGGPAEPPATHIAVDEDAGVMRFMVRGKEVARFTEDGLRVRDSIEYGGTLTDTGTAHFESTDPAERSAGEGTDAP